MINKNKNTSFYCFSPPVMLFTFFVEIILIIYTLFKFSNSSVRWLAVLILYFLAIFQLSEYFVCGGLNISPALWSSIGYIAITTLPALGLHLMLKILKIRHQKLLLCAYASMASFISLFLFRSLIFKGHVCEGNYIIFQLRDGVGYIFGMYYYFWLLVVIVLAIIHLKKLSSSHRRAVLSLLLGYLVFIIPTSIAVILQPDRIAGVASIMCGFAIFFALLIPTLILPNYYKIHPKKTSHKIKKQ